MQANFFKKKLHILFFSGKEGIIIASISRPKLI